VSCFQILLIDDNEHDRHLTERELRRQFPDSTVSSVSTRKALAQALKEKRYHLVITDFHLPWSDGLTLSRQIREQDPACPVILYTGSDSSKTAARALKAGVDDYVIKSADHLSQLMASVRLALSRKTREQTAEMTKDRYQHRFQTLPVGLLLFNPSGRLIDINPRMVSMLGYPDRESVLSLGRENFFESDEVEKIFHRKLREKIDCRAVSRTATPKNYAASCGVFTSRESGIKTRSKFRELGGGCAGVSGLAIFCWRHPWF
jgi:DNA-binding response OmpR family regulator